MAQCLVLMFLLAAMPSAAEAGGTVIPSGAPARASGRLFLVQAAPGAAGAVRAGMPAASLHSMPSRPRDTVRSGPSGNRTGSAGMTPHGVPPACRISPSSGEGIAARGTDSPGALEAPQDAAGSSPAAAPHAAGPAPALPRAHSPIRPRAP